MSENRSVKLQQAIAYETKMDQLIPKAEKPSFHMTPPVGWINDPNGFSEYKGEYHLFYQYHPYDTHWGPMHWGHSTTKDFVKWEKKPCALAPDMVYDGQGCFSGSAIEHEGKHYLMYTSVQEKKQGDGTVKVRQTQSIAVGDGIVYEKAADNPVITADQLPEGSSLADFRDPKIWKDGDTLYAVVGSLHEDGSGQIAMFSSGDGLHWNFEKILDRCKNEYGKMWECPDFFALDGKQLLVVSPQFMTAKGLEFHNGNNALYFVGSYDRDKKNFVREKGFQIDHGLDFYAPQTMETADGRRIMIAWMQSWDNYLTPEQMKWSGMMTLPRELSLKDGRLLQKPVRELANYYGKSIVSGTVTCKGGSFIPGRDALENGEKPDETTEIIGVCGRQFDMTIEAEAGEYERFEIDLACDAAHKTMVYYEPKASVLTFDRRFSGDVHDRLYEKSAYVKKQNGKIKLRIIMDKYTVEIFVNDGEQTMSCLTFTDLEAEKIRFASEGMVHFTVDFHEVVVK